MGTTHDLVVMIAACGGMLLFCGFLIWMREDRYRAVRGKDGPRIIRNPQYDWLALAAIVLSTGVHILLGGWPVDFSVPFAWHTYLMWAGWVIAPGIVIWNHWDDPPFWNEGRNKWWI